MIDEIVSVLVFGLTFVLVIYIVKSVVRFAGYLKSSRPKYVTLDEFNRTLSLINRRIEAESRETENRLKKAISSIPFMTKVYSLSEYVCKIIRKDTEYMLECECSGVPFFKKSGFKDEKEAEEWFKKHSAEVKTRFKEWLKGRGG